MLALVHYAHPNSFIYAIIFNFFPPQGVVYVALVHYANPNLFIYVILFNFFPPQGEEDGNKSL